MKKKLLAVLAGLMVLTMGTTVFAANSPSTQDLANITKGEIVSEFDEEYDLVVDITEVTADDVAGAKSAVDELIDVPDGKVASIIGMTDLKLYYNDIHILYGDEKWPEGGVKIKLYFDGVVADGTYYVLHGLDDGTWEKIDPDEIGNGYVVATFESFSPVAIVEVTDASENGGTDGGSSNETDGTSPKTGAAFPVLPVLAMVCVAGIAVCGKKVKFNA